MSGPPAGAAPPAPQVSPWTLLRVFGRSLFLQASWNPQGMQNLGLAYALFPALKDLYPDPERQMAAVRRHLAFFNTQPCMAAAIAKPSPNRRNPWSDRMTSINLPGCRGSSALILTLLSSNVICPATSGAVPGLTV